MNPSYESTSSSSAQPDVPPPTRTRWPPTPTVKACGSNSAVRRRNSGISCAELAAIEESAQGDAGGVERLAAALVAVHDAQRLDHDGAGGDDSVSSGQKRAAGGERVVDQEDAGTGPERGSLDGAPGSVRLDLFAHDERGDGTLCGAAQRGDARGDGVRAEREPADGFDGEAAAPLQREARDQVQPAAVQRHLLAVDVVVAAAPAGEHEVTELHGAAGKQRVKLVAQRGEVLAHAGADGIDASRDQRSIGCRAALTSSTRRTGVSCGPACPNARPRSAPASIVEVIAVTVAFDGGCGEEVDEASVHANRAGAGPATAVRCREGLVQIEVHDIEAHVAGPRDADQRVEVRTVVVEERTGVVRQLRDLQDVFLEDSERVRVGQHDRGDVRVEV